MPDTIIAGNWKMHGNVPSADALARAVVAATGNSRCTVLVFPPAVLLATVLQHTGGSHVGAGVQNVHALAEGAYTGEISAEMARSAGAGWALVGHSERRALCAEDDAAVGAKTLACLRAGLQPVVCVGEDLDARRGGRAEAVVTAQLDGLLAVTGSAALREMVLAYEPVWAIGTGETATPEVAQTMHAHIRRWLVAQGADAVSLLYGGSVNEKNAAALLAMPDINGALVGGASLDAQRFGAICQAAG